MGSVTKEQVVDSLKEVYDPEIPIDIFNLGLVYDVEVSDADEVHVRMTLTSQSCPAAKQIPEDVKRKVMQIPGAQACEVEVVWDPPWGPERITPEGRKMGGLDADD